MQVVECTGLEARCRTHAGEERSVDLALVGPQPAGAWLLVFLNSAREVIDAARAQEIHDALSAVAAVMAGHTMDVDALFPDLVGREPPLPEHLRALVNREENDS